MQFSHLHVHTQYSLLDGASSISSLVEKAIKDGMPAIAITDHGNMYGVPEFVGTAFLRDEEKRIININPDGTPKVKPIIGCEFYLAPRSRFEKTKVVDPARDDKNFYHQLLLAKNQTGYKNLCKLSSLGFTEGFYYKPRIDKELIRQYHEGLIASTCCLASEINQAILYQGEKEGEKIFKEYLEIFGEDYYVELQRHGIPEQDKCNEILLKWAKKYNVKIIATNDVHYIESRDSEAQDILLCLQTGKDMEDPKRLRFDGNQFFFKTQAEMTELFKDLPHAIDNTNDVVSKIETVDLKRDILLPNFQLPQGFKSDDEYLSHLSYEGAKQRYPSLTPEIQQRIDFELSVIRKMGFAGYFLIVQDFVATAKKLGVWVGPGRGSAAGSVVAYCTGITNIDPVVYNLLFERFLNPERVSMPDIDIDFDDEGRNKVIDYVINKYGKDRVAQIVTFGTMAAKSSIRDVARVLKLPLPEADRLAKLVPKTPDITLVKAFRDVRELAQEKKSSNPLITKTLQFAEVLDGTVRHTGIHAAGVIIAPDNLTEYIPICTAKDADLYVTQYEGSYAEKVGMLKMDFLGLTTLSIMKDAITLIEENHKVKIDIDTIPLNDKKTFELFQRGDTVSIFQFESEGMRMYLKELRPTNLEDLIAMNALYRPGAMDDIPSYINRRTGREKVIYPHPLIGNILKPTFGIFVYQEQVMLAVQQLAGFTKGQADTLRKAMGKKKPFLLEGQRTQFISGAKQKGMDEKSANDLFDRMAKFGGYGFNRSHSAAYALLAYQTGYLKAHYPAEYMAAALTHNMNNLEDLSFFMDECKRMGIPVLGPDVNESGVKFSVNKKGEIRFGLAAVKGAGEAAVSSIIEERKKSGNYKNIFDLTKRVNLRAANKKVLEALALSGAFDSFANIHRAQYFFQRNGEGTAIELALRFGSEYQGNNDTSQHSLFGDGSEIELKEPGFPDCPKWSRLEQITKEKEVTGLYLSGHPLDDFLFEMENFCTHDIAQLQELEKLKNQDVSIAGIVTEVQHLMTKKGVPKPYGRFIMEDYSGSFTFTLWSEEYLKSKHLLEKNNFLYARGRVQLRYNTTDQYEFRPSLLMLLSDVSNRFVHGITLNIPVKILSDDFIENINNLVSKNPGKCKLKFVVEDHEEELKLGMFSSRFRVSPNRDLFRALQKTEGIRFQIN